MTVTISLYGKLSETIGREVQFSCEPAPATIAELRRALAAQYPGTSADLLSPRLRACVNDLLVGDEHVVAPGDAVALLPPVSGG